MRTANGRGINAKQDDERSVVSTEVRRPPGDDGRTTFRSPTVDEMSEWSFPASDPPATWTWAPRWS
jgi:hypothetical protein